MCDALEVSRSGYYAWVRRQKQPSTRAVKVAERRAAIARVHTQSRETYGSPRVHAQLVRERIQVGKQTVAREMRAAGLRGKVKRRYRVTTQSKHNKPIAPNVLNQRFQATTSDTVWCADITFVSTKEGWVYLAFIIDLATRMIVGWSMATHMRTELVEDALQHALNNRQLGDGAVHHSDRGTQYASNSFRAKLEAAGIQCSMSGRGNCYDNAVAESFIGTYKQELAHHCRWTNLAEARAATFEYIEVFYNRQRLHSALGYRTPAEADGGAA